MFHDKIYDEEKPLITDRPQRDKKRDLFGLLKAVALLAALVVTMAYCTRGHHDLTQAQRDLVKAHWATHGAKQGSSSSVIGEPKLCGRPLSALPSMHMIYMQGRPERLKFIQNNTAGPILKHLQFHDGFDPRSYSWEELRDVMQQEGWHPFPSFGNLQHLEGEKAAMRDKILGRCLGFRDGESSLGAADGGDVEAGWPKCFPNQKFYTRDLTLGQLGNMVSHHRIWQQIAQNSKAPGWAIVLEDDRAVNDVAGLCNFIDKVEALPKVNGQPAWDYINVAPCEYRRLSPENAPDIESDGSFHRVRSSMCTSFYALTGNYAKYLEAANPGNCLRATDDFTTFACDPASQPMREAFGACWPRLKEQRRCFNWAGNWLKKAFFKRPQNEWHSTDVSTKTTKDGAQLESLRKELGTDDRIENPFA